jgi:hypothetical protein
MEGAEQGESLGGGSILLSVVSSSNITMLQTLPVRLGPAPSPVSHTIFFFVIPQKFYNGMRVQREVTRLGSGGSASAFHQFPLPHCRQCLFNSGPSHFHIQFFFFFFLIGKARQQMVCICF